MKNKEDIEGVQNRLLSYREKYREVKKDLEDLKEEEKRIKEELDRVRDHVEYYEALISDMKKKMDSQNDFDLFKKL